ncbi:hypothetical protein M8J77_005447 [Diaphorina citri]|nr:hypothetical protein M8J77_005447 [Diaphorina citri]
MGLLISRFRKKKNAEEKLEDLTQKIQKIEEFQECEEEKLRQRVRQLVIYSAIIYVFILCVYIILDPVSGKKYIILTLVLSPIIIFLVRKLIIYYYKRKIIRNKIKIEVYKKDKQKILDDVMETETYKVAKRILEKYDVHYSSKKFTPPKISTPIPIPKPSSGPVTPYQSSMINTDLRKRTTRDIFFNQNSSQLVSAQKPPPTLVRPIISENKGVFDRILQKVVGDGPNDRFALICNGCGSHNGMALAEEFEFLSYRCAFCGYFNPARKQRPVVPRVLTLMAIKNSSDSDSSDEKKPLEIRELEDSESESKEDSPKKLIGEIKKDDAKNEKTEEASTTSKSEESHTPVQPSCSTTHDGKENADAIEKENIDVTDKEENKENEECMNSDGNQETNKEVAEVKGEVPEEKSGGKIGPEKTEDTNEPASDLGCPMEVDDDDENTCAELSSTVNKIALDS